MDPLRLIPLSWQGEQLLPTEEFTSREEHKQKLEVTLLYTTDFHSSITMGPELPANVGGIARIATTIRQARETSPTLVLDNGDAVFGGASWWDAYGAVTTARLRKAAGCDLASLGNHDLEHGLEGLRELCEGGYPFVATNLTFDDPYYNARIYPAYIAELAGWRIGLVGLTTPETLRLLPRKLRQGWILTDPLKSLHAALRELDPLVDTIILLSHLGYIVGDQLGDRNLAPQLSDSKVSVILGGHTHGALIPAPVINGIVVCSAGAFGEYVGEVKLAWHNSHAVEVRARLIRQDETIAEDPEVLALCRACAQKFELLHRSTFILPLLPDLGTDGLTTGLGTWTINRDTEALLLVRAINCLSHIQQGSLLLVPLLYMMGKLPAENPEISLAELFQVYGNTEQLVEIEILGRDLKSSLSGQSELLFFMQALPLWVDQQARVKEELLEDERVYHVITTECVSEGGLGWTAFSEVAQGNRALGVNCFQTVQQYLSSKKG